MMAILIAQMPVLTVPKPLVETSLFETGKKSVMMVTIKPGMDALLLVSLRNVATEESILKSNVMTGIKLQQIPVLIVKMPSAVMGISGKTNKIVKMVILTLLINAFNAKQPHAVMDSFG